MAPTKISMPKVAPKAAPTSHIVQPVGTVGRAMNGMGRALGGLSSIFGILQVTTLLGMGARALTSKDASEDSFGVKAANIIGKPAEWLSTPVSKLTGEGVMDSVGNALGSTWSAVGRVTGAQDRAEKNYAGIAEALAKAQERAETKLPGMEGILGKLREAAEMKPTDEAGALEQKTKFEAAKNEFEAARTKAEGFLNNPVRYAKDAFNAEKQKAAFKRYADAIINEPARREERVNFWKDPKAGIASRLKNMSITEGLGYAMRYGYTAYQLYGGAVQARGGMRAIKQLYKDVTGKDVSTWTILTNKDALPPIVRQARHEYLSGVLPKVGLLGGVALSQEAIYRGMHKRFGNPFLAHAGSTLAFKGVELLDGQFSKQNRMAPVYETLHIAEMQGNKLDANAYIALITSSCMHLKPKNVEKAGGFDFTDVYNQHTQDLAVYFADKQASVAEVMQELNKGLPRMKELSAVGEAVLEKYNNPPSHAGDMEPAPSASQSGWVQKMSMGGAPMQAIHGGKYTEKLRSEAMAPVADQQRA